MLWLGLFWVPSTDTSVICGDGWLTDWKKASRSDCTQPPPNSMMAITPPPARPVGQLYAAQRFGTVQGPAVASCATARAKAVNNLRRLKYGLQRMAGDGLMGFSLGTIFGVRTRSCNNLV